MEGMSLICCRCCFTTDSILLPLKTKSCYKDDQTLLDYLNLVLGSFIKEFEVPQYICLRCSKALQVAYHFIKLALQSEDVIKCHQAELMGNPINIEIQQQHQENQSNVGEIGFENQSKININKRVIKNQQIDFKKATKVKKFNILKCIICNELFDSKDLLMEHNRKMHKEFLPLKCEICKFYSCYTESLFKHYKKKHGLKRVELKLYQTKELRNTVAAENPKFEITYKCVECEFEGLTQTSIDEHLFDNHFINEDKDLFIREYYNCPSCYRSFTALKSVKTHYTMCHQFSFKRTKISDNKKYACEKCGKIFDLKSGLLLHRRVCEKRNAVNCNFCKLKFTSVLKYEQHLEDKHSVVIKHECEICSKTFNCSEYLTVHRKRHNERYYQCDLCSRNYISNAELKVHKQRIHSGRQVSKQCGICGKSFDHLSLLRKHENTEHNKRYYKCVYCDFETHSRFAIRVHQYTHTGKPYKCKLCPKEFVFRKDLKHHCERQHSFNISNEDMAEIFKQSYGYTSRFDAFSKQNNNLEISDITELELEGELKEFGLTLQDIMEGLFDDEMTTGI